MGTKTQRMGLVDFPAVGLNRRSPRRVGLAVSTGGPISSSAQTMKLVHLDQRVPLCHPLRVNKHVDDDVLDHTSGDFERMCLKIGRTSVPPLRNTGR